MIMRKGQVGTLREIQSSYSQVLITYSLFQFVFIIHGFCTYYASTYVIKAHMRTLVKNGRKTKSRLCVCVFFFERILLENSKEHSEPSNVTVPLKN